MCQCEVTTASAQNDPVTVSQLFPPANLPLGPKEIFVINPNGLLFQGFFC